MVHLQRVANGIPRRYSYMRALIEIIVHANLKKHCPGVPFATLCSFNNKSHLKQFKIMRRRVHKTATLPPFPRVLTEVLTCVQFAMHSDLPRDIPFIPFLFSQCFLFFFSHPFNFYLIIVKLESSPRQRSLNLKPFSLGRLRALRSWGDVKL